jgi:matrixin
MALWKAPLLDGLSHCGHGINLRTNLAFMVIMIPLGRTFFSFLQFPPKTRPYYLKSAFRFFACVAILTSLPNSLHAYALENKSWPNPTTLTFHIQLGTLSKHLQDGSTSWAAAVAPAFTTWNSALGGMTLHTVATASAVSSGDRVNSIVFSPTVFGQAFGSSTLAVTYYSTMNNTMVEADILFNTAQPFDSYRGALQFGSNGHAISDIRRVLLHELGHAIGLDHPDSHGQHVAAVMNSIISNQDTLSTDDKNGGQSIYGAPSTTTPITSTSRLVNISTRMKVGINDDVLIGGFIITGTQSKRVILRAIGPTLTASGVAGALSNPTMELHNSTGALIASNDDWQQSAQAGQIASSGIAPTNLLESAIIATLAPGSYTAIVRGVNNTTGIAMIEGYELGSGVAKLVNISTRGRVATGDAVLIGGFIVQGTGAKKILVRALGPSLGIGPGAVSHALANPFLELRNSAGVLVYSNDNWGSSPWGAQISATGIPPTRAEEAAILASLNPGTYTAIVRGVNNTSGVALIELYDLDQ